MFAGCLCAPAFNDMFKFTDDTTLLVPEHKDINIDIEFSHVN